ncbi:galectin-1-like isoform X2 [Notamacropus eugenii]|uniref:galectin-1-like isoform X2 n=1 Tax=Notamacropus eugenii TaxID=9315 RepID=UPI003B68125E
MPLEVYLWELNVKPGTKIKVKGDILPDAELFRINVGKNELNIGLHFNPRFNYLGDYNIIVCNARTEGTWGTEERINHFPYVPGATIEVTIILEGDYIRVKLHDSHEFTFPNRLNLTKIDHVGIYGDMNVRQVDFE